MWIGKQAGAESECLISNLTLKSQLVTDVRLERTPVPSGGGTVRLLKTKRKKKERKKTKQQQHPHMWANGFYPTVF